jgi:hypothetical protein
MPIDITAEAKIAAPRERVAAFAMDPRNDASWIGSAS